jgi:DNA-binding FadR family transcriptional regulator
MIRHMSVSEASVLGGAHRTNHGHVSDAIGLRILEGRVLPGQQIPNEGELVAELGVGRGAVREAVKALEAKGLLESRPRTGTRVRGREAWNFLDADVLRWQWATDPERLADGLSDLRGAVEPHAASLAAMRATVQDIEALEDAFARMTAAAQDQPRAFVQADMDFHLAVLGASHNDLFVSLGHAVGVALFGSFEKGMQAPGAVAASLPRHELVLNAIRVGAAQSASAAALDLVATSIHDIAVAGPWGAR